jgi:RNA polymerase sigma factor (TIGR02999 family)
MPTQDMTQLLIAWGQGDQQALETLVPLVEAELHRLARRYLNNERPGHTLQATALVNEAYIRLIDWKNVQWQNRAHFFGVSANLMRRILVDHVRHKQYQKRGGQGNQVTFDEQVMGGTSRPLDLVALDDALKELAKQDSRKAEIVELRFFGGLSVEEAAEVLKISPRTVKREWSLAQAWLYSELSNEDKSDV